MADWGAPADAADSIRSRLVEIEAKAGILGPAIGDSHGARLLHVHARRNGVIVTPDNKFQCPPGTARGGKFTDATGSTCGIPEPEKPSKRSVASAGQDAVSDDGDNEMLAALEDNVFTLLDELTSTDENSIFAASDSAKALLEASDGDVTHYFRKAFHLDLRAASIISPAERSSTHVLSDLKRQQVAFSEMVGKSQESFVPPQDVRAAAKRGLVLRAEYKRGGTMVGVARARDLSNGKALSASTIMRMVSYFARHEVDKQGKGWDAGSDGYPSAGRIAWLLWGGDPGRRWANAMARRIRSAES